MTSQQLYDTIKEIFPQSEVASICFTDQVCLRHGFCSSKQSINVINFDFIKDEFCKGQTKKPTSVDAICVSGTDKAFYFIELKGWKKYIENYAKQKLSPRETAEGYKLSKKLSESQQLCIQLTSNTNLFDNIPIRFLLVTDIDTQTKGLESLHSMLNQLGQTSTNIYLNCWQEARSALDSEIMINRDYISCKDFDLFLSKH